MTLSNGDTYESYDHALCSTCNTKWQQLILVRVVEAGTYHRREKTLGAWTRSEHSFSSYSFWTEDDGKCPACNFRLSQLSLFDQERER
jgi:hypothetical protein